MYYIVFPCISSLITFIPISPLYHLCSATLLRSFFILSILGLYLVSCILQVPRVLQINKRFSGKMYTWSWIWMFAFLGLTQYEVFYHNQFWLQISYFHLLYKQIISIDYRYQILLSQFMKFCGGVSRKIVRVKCQGWQHHNSCGCLHET